MKKDEKAVIIDQLQEMFAKANFGILTNYRGLKTNDLLELRQKMKAANGRYEVVKNTLAHFAADKAGVTQIAGLLNETTAIAFGFGEVRDLAVAVTDFTRTSKAPLTVKGGFLGGRLLTPQDIVTLTTLPTKQVLIARLMGQLQSPIASLMGQLNAPVSGLANVLRARMKQLEGGAN